MDKLASRLAVASLAALGLFVTGCAASHIEPPPTTPAMNSSAPTVVEPQSTTPPTNRPMHHHRSHASSGRFRLMIHTPAVTIDAAVAPLSVESHQPVDPPHHTAKQWLTAAWISESTFPDLPKRGTSYIYGHACHYHVCSFTKLKDARLGGTVRITTRSDELTYRIDRIGLSPKTASTLPPWASDSTVPDRVVLVTCNYERGDTSLNNLVVEAHLVDRRRSATSPG